MLTVQVLTKNNSKTIRRCLASLGDVDCRVVVGDMGSEDGTEEIARGMGADVRRLDFSGDMSAMRNSLLSSGMNMRIDPWERLVRGSEVVTSIRSDTAVYVVQSGIVSKQVRLWEGPGRFENPVFETLESESAVVVPAIVLVSEGAPDTRESDSEACRAWMERRPTSPDPHYYLACSLLAQGRTKEFLSSARTYLSLARPGGDSTLLMNYYMARAEFATGSPRDAYRRALGCLVVRPSYAEFWCLLGDMFCHRGDYRRAASMYRNALLAGRMRPSDDFFPLEISKYDSYPKEMEEKCLSAMSEKLLVGGKAGSAG